MSVWWSRIPRAVSIGLHASVVLQLTLCANVCCASRKQCEQKENTNPVFQWGVSCCTTHALGEFFTMTSRIITNRFAKKIKNRKHVECK